MYRFMDDRHGPCYSVCGALANPSMPRESISDCNMLTYCYGKNGEGGKKANVVFWFSDILSIIPGHLCPGLKFPRPLETVIVRK